MSGTEKGKKRSPSERSQAELEIATMGHALRLINRLKSKQARTRIARYLLDAVEHNEEGKPAPEDPSQGKLALDDDPLESDS